MSSTEECLRAVVAGEIPTMIMFAIGHQALSGIEVVVFWAAVHMLWTVAAWALLIEIERRKNMEKIKGPAGREATGQLAQSENASSLMAILSQGVSKWQ
mgnify:CR=1 FL=1